MKMSFSPVINFNKIKYSVFILSTENQEENYSRWSENYSHWSLLIKTIICIVYDFSNEKHHMLVYKCIENYFTVKMY